MTTTGTDTGYAPSRPQGVGDPVQRPRPSIGWLGDSRLTAGVDGALILLSLLAVATSVADPPGSWRPLLVLAAASLVPGGALLTRLAVRSTLDGLAFSLVISLSISAAAALALVWTGWWHPVAVSLVILAASCLLLLHDLVRNFSVWRLDRAEGAASAADSPGPARASFLLLCLGPVASLLLWLLSLPDVDIYSLGSYGLPPALPVTWYLALLIAVLGAVAAIAVRPGRGLLMGLSIALVGVILFGTVPALSGQPHYAWVYKHIGVVLYLETHHQVNPNIDIYNRWPGFFALSAMLSPLAGRPNPATYAGWADLFFLLVDAVLVAAVARAVVNSVRVAGGAALFFITTNWVAQTYFSPQAFGYALALGVLLTLLRHFQMPQDTWAVRLRAVVPRLGQARPTAMTELAQASWPRGVALALLFGVWAIIVASHQLTPYVVLVSVAALLAAGIIRPWWLLLPMAAMTVGYLLPNLHFVQQNYGLFTSIDPFNNVQGAKLTSNTPVPGKVFNTNLQLVLIGVSWLFAAAAAARLWSRAELIRALPFVLLALTPFVVIFGQSYGGEAPLRIILFSCPWFAALTACGLATISSSKTRVALTAAAAVALTALFVPSFLGQEELNVVSRPEFEASAYFYEHGRPHSLLLLSAPGFPYRYGGTYPIFAGPEGDANPNLMQQPRFRNRRLGPADVPAVVQSIHQYAKHGYIAFSRNQAIYARIFNIVPPGSMGRLEAAVARSRRFRLWYENGSTRIYELVGSEPDRGAAAASGTGRSGGGAGSRGGG